MKSATIAVLSAASLLALAGSASAAVVCNDDGDCWHVQGHARYKPGLHLHVHPDNWKWGHGDHYRWREHKGHGYWHGGVWLNL
jgi:hypothetical protein